MKSTNFNLLTSPVEPNGFLVIFIIIILLITIYLISNFIGNKLKKKENSNEMSTM